MTYVVAARTVTTDLSARCVVLSRAAAWLSSVRAVSQGGPRTIVSKLKGITRTLDVFLDRAKVQLQIELETGLKRNPSLESSRAKLLDFAWDTHSEA